jgi:hypothetical protein
MLPAVAGSTVTVAAFAGAEADCGAVVSDLLHPAAERMSSAERTMSAERSALESRASERRMTDGVFFMVLVFKCSKLEIGSRVVWKNWLRRSS